MRVVHWIAAAVLGGCLIAAPAVAQMRPPIFIPPPGGAKVRPMMPPSGAVNTAVRNFPGSRALGVVQNGGGYNVRLKQGNRIILVPVPGN